MTHTPGDLPPPHFDPPDQPDWTHPATSAQAFDAQDHAHQQLQAAEVAELVAITHAADLYQVDINHVLDGMERLIPGGTAKTHGGWHLEQPAPGHFKWTSPAGYQYLVTPDGTTAIGKPEKRT
ncbi:MAG: hypothetical protein ACOX61_04765 [Brooklawnia sp.]